MELLSDWIEQNFLQVETIDANTLKIQDNYYSIIHPKDVIFSESFDLILDLDTTNSIEQYDSKYIVFYFGNTWYYTRVDCIDNDNVQFNEFRYIGICDNLFETTDNVFLGIHGKYEILNGTRDYSAWISKAKFHQYTTLGICEKHTLAGTLPFQLQCTSNNIQSILGYTVQVIHNGINYDFKLYCIDNDGWRNLIAINNAVDQREESLNLCEDLIKYSSGLICIIPSNFRLENFVLRVLNNAFNNVYYQIDPVKYLSNDIDKEHLLAMKHYFDKFYDKVPCVLINDAFYLERQDSEVVKILNSIAKVGFSKASNDKFFKVIDESFDQLAQLFFEDDDRVLDIFERCIESTHEIARVCKFNIDTKTLHLPQYDHDDREGLFFALIEEGLSNKFEDIPDYYFDRIDQEVEVIIKGGFIDYFLILWDIVNYCNDSNILVGIGRGSAGGCFISYLLGITKVNPLQYGLLFERFLNEGRIGKSLPDIDIDFPGAKRDQVKAYMESKYGKDNVCAVGTYGTLQSKQAIRDFARVHNIPIQTATYMTAMLDIDSGKWSDIFVNASGKPQLKKFVQDNAYMIEQIRAVHAQPRTKGVHACATIIVPNTNNQTIHDLIPTRKHEGLMVSEWEGEYLEKAGFLKEDILGIRQLDKFATIFSLVKEHEEVVLDLDTIPLDDKRVFEAFSKGYNQDTFHFGTQGLIAFSQDMKPDSMSDLIAMIALHRPGPMTNKVHIDYINRKHGRSQVELDHPLLQEITEETYGLLCIDEDSFITLRNGRVKIKNIRVGNEVLTQDGSFQKVLRVIDNGNKDTVKVRGTFGEELVCTPDHKILTHRGWVEAQDLTSADMIKSFWCTPLQYDFGDVKDWLLGLYLADGSSASIATYYCHSKQFAENVKTLLEQQFSTMKGIDIQPFDNGLGICWRLYVKQKNINNGSFNSNYEENEFNLFLKDNGLFKKTKDEKFWPESANLNTLAGFLEGDSCVKEGILRLKYEHLARGIFETLQSYRIYSSLYLSSDGYWTIKYVDVDRKIPFKFKSIPDNRQIDIFTLRQYLPHLQSRHGFDYKNHSIPSVRKKKPYIYKQIVIKYGGVIDHEVWSRVLSVQTHKQCRVFDISVNNIHSFVAGGLVVHNCYQEQIMKTCQVLANFSLVEADDIRKAMGKKIMSLLEGYKDRFINGCLDNNVDEHVAQLIWSKMLKFAKYAFNKSHAAAYAITGYISQWLKVNYPLQFWISAFQYAKELDYARYIEEISNTASITIVPPDINNSESRFISDAQTNTIYWSLSTVKQCGEIATQMIVDERKSGGQFYSIEEFLSRVPKNKVNKAVVTNLILCGCFDSLYDIQVPSKRYELIKEHNKLIKSKKLPTIFDNDDIQYDWWWTLKQKELCALGNINYEELAKTAYANKPSNIPVISASKLQTTSIVSSSVCVAGIVVDFRERSSRKSNRKFAQIQLECNNEVIHCTAWSDQWELWADHVRGCKGRIVIMTGKVVADSWKKCNAIHSTKQSKIFVV